MHGCSSNTPLFTTLACMGVAWFLWLESVCDHARHHACGNTVAPSTAQTSQICPWDACGPSDVETRAVAADEAIGDLFLVKELVTWDACAVCGVDIVLMHDVQAPISARGHGELG